MFDLVIIWLFILVPLALFLAAYLLETYVSFRRLSNPKKGPDYLASTWEITHTLLVVSVALFVGFFSGNLIEIAYVAFYPLFLASVFVGIRTLAYIYLFMIRGREQQSTRSWIDTVFAWSHVGVIVSLLYLLAVLIPKLFSIEIEANTQFIPWMIPGAFLITALCVAPIMSLYRSK
jgi:hypothetical protein